MLAALTGMGPDMGFCGVTERESYGVSDAPSCEDVTDADEKGPTVYIGVQICVTVALVGIAVE